LQTRTKTNSQSLLDQSPVHSILGSADPFAALSCSRRQTLYSGGVTKCRLHGPMLSDDVPRARGWSIRVALPSRRSDRHAVRCERADRSWYRDLLATSRALVDRSELSFDEFRTSFGCRLPPGVPAANSAIPNNNQSGVTNRAGSSAGVRTHACTSTAEGMPLARPSDHLRLNKHKETLAPGTPQTGFQLVRLAPAQDRPSNQ
jgi:hypothetical protein